LTVTSGTVQVDLDLTINETSLKAENKPSSQNFVVSKGVDLGKITTLESEVFIDQLAVFPTQVKNELNILIDTKIDAVEILKLDGTVLIEGTTNNINVSSLTKGVYLVKVQSENKTYTTRISK
jgi:hypothetical protein